MVQSCFHHLRNFQGSDRFFLPKIWKPLFVHAFITSRLDYGYSLISGINKNISFHFIINFAARIITQTKKQDHISPILALRRVYKHHIIWILPGKIVPISLIKEIISVPCVCLHSCSLNTYTKVLENGNSSTSRVSVQIFSFVDLDVIYLHCQVQICVDTGSFTCVPVSTSLKPETTLQLLQSLK